MTLIIDDILILTVLENLGIVFKKEREVTWPNGVIKMDKREKQKFKCEWSFSSGY